MRLKKLAVLEVGEATWKCGVFTVPQKLSIRQLENDKGWKQVWRVVVDLKPLNAAVELINSPLPLITDIYQFAG